MHNSFIDENITRTKNQSTKMLVLYSFLYQSIRAKKRNYYYILHIYEPLLVIVYVQTVLILILSDITRTDNAEKNL